ncbi:MAG: PorV/PorQ family protein [Candidatus Krumholzibacteriota bacterium]
MVGNINSKMMILPAVCLLALAVTSGAWAGNPGDAGLLSLRMGIGAREAAMGETGVASSEGAAAVFWNPANNVFAEFETGLVLQHHRYLGLFNHESAAVAHRMGDGVLGVIFMGFYSDDLNRYGAEPVGIPEGTFKPYDVALGVSYAHPLGESFAAAVTAKLLYEKIDIYSDTGFAFDFFLTHKAMIDGLVFGFSATNLGGKLNLNAEPFQLPTAVRVGAAWTPVDDFFQEKLTLAGDVVFPNDTREKAHVGAEFRIIPEFSLRAGTRINYTNQGLTAGAGFRAGALGVDYAYEESTVEGFDDGHKFSLNLVW